ncbi:MAG: O-antigen ligase family protein [Marinobacter adhaerens]
MRKKRGEVCESEFYGLKLNALWRFFKGESFAFWMVCAYLFLEYVRPQSIFPVIDFLPWTQLAVIGAIIGCFTDKTVRWVSSPVNKLYVIYFLIVVVSSYLAYFPSVSFENLYKYYLWIIIYFIIINIVNTERRFFIFISIFLAASFKLSLSLSMTWASRGFSFTDWGLMGPPGFFQNSGELAIQMLVYWPIACAFIYLVKPYIGRFLFYFLALMPVTAIMVILGASSRGAQLALVVQLTLIGYKYIFKPKVIVVILLSIISVWFFLPDEQKLRFSTMGEDGTSKQRLLYWENGVDMIENNPVFGVGYFNFAPYFERYYPEDVILRQAELPHNIFIQVGTDVGLLGLTVFLLFIFYSMKISASFSRKCNIYKKNILGLYFNTSLVGFLVAGQFVTVTYYPFLWIHLAFVVALNNVLNSSRKDQINKS